MLLSSLHQQSPCKAASQSSHSGSKLVLPKWVSHSLGSTSFDFYLLQLKRNQLLTMSQNINKFMYIITILHRFGVCFFPNQADFIVVISLTVTFHSVIFFPERTEESIPLWQNRDPTPEEERAALIIQTAWRGTYVRQLMNGRRPGQKSSFFLFVKMFDTENSKACNSNLYDIHHIVFIYLFEGYAPPYPISSKSLTFIQ